MPDVKQQDDEDDDDKTSNAAGCLRELRGVRRSARREAALLRELRGAPA